MSQQIRIFFLLSLSLARFDNNTESVSDINFCFPFMMLSETTTMKQGKIIIIIVIIILTLCFMVLTASQFRG